MRSTSWISSLLLLSSFFFSIFGIQAQTIDNVILTGTPVCKPATIQISFMVTNGNGNGSYFTSNTIYKFSLGILNGTTFNEISVVNNSFTNAPFPTGNPINGAFITISESFQIPSTVLNGSNYLIKITSSIDPYVAIEAYSVPFVISSPAN